MQTERFTLTTRHGMRLVGLVDYPDGEGPVGQVLALCHGYGGNKEGFYLRTITAALTEAGIAGVRFDFTNAVGESQGSIRDASVGGYADDLEDVLDFLPTRPRLAQARQSIAGHSYSGRVVLLVASRRPLVEAVFFLSGVYRGDDPAMAAAVARIRAPIYIIHGEQDEQVPLRHAEALAAAAGDKVAGLTIVTGADHNYIVPGTATVVAAAIRDALEGLPRPPSASRSTAG